MRLAYGMAAGAAAYVVLAVLLLLFGPWWLTAMAAAGALVLAVLAGRLRLDASPRWTRAERDALGGRACLRGALREAPRRTGHPWERM